jgi:hypothetical protein
VSFGAYMIGSVYDDLISLVFRARRARAFTVGSEGGLDLLDSMGEAGRMELERLEAAIDRASSEFTLRVGLFAPLMIALVATQVHQFQPPLAWSLGLAGVLGALAFQCYRRSIDLRRNLDASKEIRYQAGKRLDAAQRRLPSGADLT